MEVLPPDESVPTLASWRLLRRRGSHRATNQSSVLAVIQQRPELLAPPTYFTPDWDAAKASVRRLAELTPETVAPGHGPAMHPEFTDALRTLAIDFDRIARPEHGKYAHQGFTTPV